jgi:hypothetical protein
VEANGKYALIKNSIIYNPLPNDGSIMLLQRPPVTANGGLVLPIASDWIDNSARWVTGKLWDYASLHEKRDPAWKAFKQACIGTVKSYTPTDKDRARMEKAFNYRGSNPKKLRKAATRFEPPPPRMEFSEPTDLLREKIAEVLQEALTAQRLAHLESLDARTKWLAGGMHGPRPELVSRDLVIINYQDAHPIWVEAARRAGVGLSPLLLQFALHATALIFGSMGVTGVAASYKSAILGGVGGPWVSLPWHDPNDDHNDRFDEYRVFVEEDEPINYHSAIPDVTVVNYDRPPLQANRLEELAVA